MPPPNKAIKKAISNAGGQLRLADRLGVTQPTVSRWIKRGRVPAMLVVMCESITGVSRHLLNPHAFPPIDVISPITLGMLIASAHDVERLTELVDVAKRFASYYERVGWRRHRDDYVECIGHAERKLTQLQESIA